MATTTPPVPTPVTAPPLDKWVSPALLSFIEHAPTNPGLRGLIRAELNVIVPGNFMSSAAGMKKYITEHYMETPAYGRLKEYHDAGRSGDGIPRLYSRPIEEPRTLEASRRVVAEEAAPGVPVGTPPPPVIDPDGSFIMRNIRLLGTETGTARFENTITYTGEIRIPGDVVRGGSNAVREFLINNRADITNPAVPNGEAEDTENYFYDAFTRTAVTIREVRLDETTLRQAIDQVTGVRRVAAPNPTGGIFDAVIALARAT